MENNGVVVAEEGRCESSHRNGVLLQVGSAQKGEIKEEQGEKEGESGSMVCHSVDEGNKEDFEDGKSAIDSIEEAEKMKKKGSRPTTNEEQGKKKRGRPKKTKEDGDKTRGMPKKNKEAGQKTRGRPKKNKAEEGDLEVMKNNEVKIANGEFVGSWDLAGEDEANDFNLECIKVEEPVQENRIAEKEGKELGEENNGRSDEGEKGKNSCGTRILEQRASKAKAQFKKTGKRGRPRKEAEKGVGFEGNGGDSEVNKRIGVGENKKKRGRKPSKGLENGDKKEVVFEENGCKSEVNKRDGDGENKKRRGRKPKGLDTQKDKGGEKEAGFEESGTEWKANKRDGDGENKQQKDNGEESGECVAEKDKEQEGVDKEKIGKRMSKCKGEEGEGEVQKEDAQNHSRILRGRTMKVNTEKACKPKSSADENVKIFG